ncbi:MAG: aldo/keto reductase [Gammaproteobacteria bacterium]|nr:aldo/keto reductase [Gammaproteobacteria bacterium]
MPRIGFGLFRVAPGATARDIAAEALTAGYRLLDTAAIYRNETEVGQAVAASGLPRDRLFVTSKVWNDDQGYPRSLTAFERAQAALGSIDLYLLHWPVPERRLAAWRALEDLYLDGRVRAIGVSNFMVHHLDELLAAARVAPMVNQVELSPFLPQRELAAYCARAGIVLTAYSPLTKGHRLAHPLLVEEATRLGCSPAQLLLRWVLAQGHALVVKSSDPQRMRENLAAGDGALDAAALARLDALDEGLVTGWDPRDAP